MGRLTPFVLAALIAGHGCGSGSESRSPSSQEPEAAATPEPESSELEGCDLITAAEVSTAIGTTVSAGEDYSMRGCRWTAGSQIAVSLEVFPGGAATCKGQEFLVSGREERVPGLGDSALWGSSGDLVVCTAGAVLNVDIESPNDPRVDKEALISMAKIVLGRL